ncbi:malonyl-CoA decarboxylase [Roseivivax sp. CAU 1753]
MSVLADLLTTVLDRRHPSAFLPGGDKRALSDLAEALVSARGEVSGQALAGEILAQYAALDDDGKGRFFDHLARNMNIAPDQVRDALDRYEHEGSQHSYRAFLAAVEPTRQEFIRRLNQVPGGTEQLVKMRTDLLRLSKDRPELQALDLDFQHLFASWFNRGFLVLRPISWDSPAQLLEKIIAYEAVHAIDSWDDMRRRVAPDDRRCFAFFHPSMPNEPLIFVEVALTRGVPGSVQALLAEDRDGIDAARANTAVFYSISNCQKGLAGISFGSSLIKQVVADLAAELPGLKTFVTLSPIPGLARWMTETAPHHWPAEGETLRALAAHYLVNARRDTGGPVDPVARFHLGNGAQVHAVHAGADTSANGLRQSGGAMVNYLYDLKKASQNHEGYATAYAVAASGEVRALAAQGAKLVTSDR